METAAVNGTEIAYETHGAGPPLLLIAGLGGVGRSWGGHVAGFAKRNQTIVVDHRGTGSSGRPDDGYTIETHAADMAELLRRLDAGPTHIVGSSTGGAIAQVMALDHPDVVRSITLVSSWAGPDDFFRHQFAIRRRVLAESGMTAYAETSALFLFSPWFFRDSYQVVRAWCEKSRDGTDVATMLKRVDMVLAFDLRERIGSIDVPTFVIVGDQDFCTPPHFSEELASGIPGAESVVLTGGHLIYMENPDDFRSAVSVFHNNLGP